MLIKEKPEDFVVEEVIELDSKASGKYAYLKVVKRDWNTVDVANELVKRLGVKRSDVGFAGSKDKRAVTTQYFSVRGLRKFEGVRIKDAEVSFFGYGDSPISLGDMKGNRFKIKLDREVKFKVRFVVNYFGEQRFGRNNASVGKAIVKREFERACFLAGIEASGNDFIGALRRIDKKILSLYVSAYQSYLWNECVRRYLRGKYDVVEFEDYVFVRKREEDELIPLLNFDSELEGDIGEIYSEILKEEGVELEDFIIRKMPELVCAGVSRELFVDVSEFEIDGFWVRFYLPKGSYATVVLKEIEGFMES